MAMANNEDILAGLVKAYEAYGAAQGLTLYSADEMLYDDMAQPHLTAPQRAWLNAFSRLWELTETGREG